MTCSVIVPLYNKAVTVQRALESIRSQTLRDFEVIIVNDGSTDHSAQQVKDYLVRNPDPRFCMIEQPNAGPGAARNRGIARSQAPLIAFLDADDEWLPHYLERACTEIGKLPPEVAGVSLAWFDEPGHRSTATLMRQRGIHAGVHRLSPETSPRLLAAFSSVIWPCTIMVRREIALRYGGFWEEGCRFGEDTHLWVKILLNHPLVFLLEEGALFHRNDSALSGNYRAMRPIEPFLLNPGDLREICPPQLRLLLDQFLALRAMKTACVLAYWGHWRQAASLRRRFLLPGAWELPWFFPSLLAASPLGGLAGHCVRALGALR